MLVGELPLVAVTGNPITLPFLFAIGGYWAILISISCSKTCIFLLF